MRLLVLFVVLVLVCEVCSVIPETSKNLALGWSREQLKVIKSTFGFLAPVGVARATSLLATGMRDAAFPYVPNWGLVTPELNLTKKSVDEHTDKNIEIAISYAAYRIIKNLFKDRQAALAGVEKYATSLGMNVDDLSENLETPKGVGNYVGRALMVIRTQDGLNQNGSSPRSLSKAPYSDWTNYYPVNDPQETPGVTNCAKLRSLNHWVPLKVVTAAGGIGTQSFASPQAVMVKPYATNPGQFRNLFGGPALFGTATDQQARDEFAEILHWSGNLDDNTKAIAEFWADGPDSTLPPGHWQEITAELAENKNLNISATIDVLALQAVATLDAGLGCWELKRLWDSARPASVLQCLNQNKQVMAWQGPYKGVGMINGSLWIPYQERHFVTPPFPEYPSGHSTFSAASAYVLTNFFGDTKCNISYVHKKGTSLFEPYIPAGKPGHIAGVTDVPNSGPQTVGYSPASDIPLFWGSLAEAADSAGVSRRYGGIHVASGDIDGRKLGKWVGEAIWNKYKTEWNPEPTTTSPPTSAGQSTVNLNFGGMLAN